MLPFGFSVVGGIALFVVLLVPVLVAQYRRYGRLSPRRILAVSAVCVYAVAVVAYTFLPLPGSTADCGPRGGARLQLVPFQFLRDIARETRGLGVVGTLTSGVTLQVVFNVALFVPFGLLVRRFGGRSLAVTTGLGLLLTLAIETTQGTALWGVYDCAWRVGDVDDVLANTLGALVGALLAPRFLSWLPRPEQLAPRRLEPRRVTPVRRWLGMVVDLTIYTVGAAVLAFAVRAGVQLAGLPAADARDGWAAALPPLLAGVATFLVPALTGTGASYGQRLVWLRPSWPAPPTLVRRLLAAAVGLAWTVSFVLGVLVDPEGPGQAVALVLSLPGLASPFAVLVTRRSRGLSLLLAGAEMTDSRRVEQGRTESPATSLGG